MKCKEIIQNPEQEEKRADADVEFDEEWKVSDIQPSALCSQTDRPAETS